MKRTLWILLLTVPLAAQQFDPARAEPLGAFVPAQFDAVYRQLLSDAPPSGVYAFELDARSVYFEAAEQRYTASFESMPVHDGGEAAENESLLLLVPSMQWVRSPRGFALIDAWGIRLPSPAGTRLSVAYPGPRNLNDDNRLAYLAIVQVEPADAPRLMKTDEPEFREATGAGFHKPDGQRIVEHAVPARVIGIRVYDRTNGKLLGKRDYRAD